jgi:hypothetical protein
MIRLFDKSKELAAQSNIEAGLPVIIDFMGGSSATIWTIVPREKLEPAGTGRFSLRLRHPAFGVEAFTIDGAALNVGAKGNVLQIDLADALFKSAPPSHLILKIPNVQGLFRAEEDGIFQFDLPLCAARVTTLFQFRLPEGAFVDAASPEIIEREKKLNKLVVTVAANSRMPEFFY